MSQAQPGGSTPASNFTSQARSSEEALKEQTTGLVNLQDFRKRKLGLLLSSDREGDGEFGTDHSEPAVRPITFKKKRPPNRGGLSFAADDDEDNVPDDAPRPDSIPNTIRARMKPSDGVLVVPVSQSKSALAREGRLKEALKKEYQQVQEAVRATDFVLPFVFFDGKDSSGGKVRMKKGDQVWLFLERARKVGAETAGKHNTARKDWARISVDDLMLVKDDLILQPHFDFHYFILNRAKGYHGPLFNLSAEPTNATPTQLLPKDPDAALDTAGTGLSRPGVSMTPEQDLEGCTDDPSTTRVVDRRWYERNKHIYPATLWEDFDVKRDYSQGGRKDRDGNQMFFT